jgi:hypothetical protein
MTDWYQQSLTPPEVVELRIRIGLIPERNHVQAMAELVDPITGVLIAQWSNPHAKMDRWMDVLEEAVAKGRQQVALNVEPF